MIGEIISIIKDNELPFSISMNKNINYKFCNENSIKTHNNLNSSKSIKLLNNINTINF